MISTDKFGNKIYPNIFSVLKKFEKILLTHGYIESKDKPNLFSKNIIVESKYKLDLFDQCFDRGKFYADMRGTEEVKIWEDPAPLFYWRFQKPVDLWLRRRLIKTELLSLYKAGCPCRLSFYFHECKEFENISTQTCDEDGVFDWPDGYCIFCKKDFRGEGEFCTPECELKYTETFIYIKCVVCDQPKPHEQIIRHHVCYNPEQTIIVCRGCHLKIHRTNQYPHLKPSHKS